MKYSDCKFTFEERDVWTFDPKVKTGENGLSFQELLKKENEFKELKEKIKEGIVQPIEKAVDEAKTEKEIGTNLDPLFERYHKSYFTSEEQDEKLLLKKANRNTLEKKLQSWCEQLNYNVPTIKKYPGVKIFHNLLKDVPAVVVTAGPSLGNAIERLKTLKGKACIIAVDTSFRSLMKRDIQPDFVNAHDANENGQKFFKGVDASNSVGVFVNYINPKTIAAYQGPLTFYYVEDHSIHTYKTMALACDDTNRKDGSFLDSHIVGGSSVAHTAMYFAMDLGCNPITFVGLDLSFPDLDKSHFETDNPKNVKSQKLIDVIDLQGRKIKTNLSFYSYKSVFDKMASLMSKLKNVDLYTCSEDENGKPVGIVHAGLRPMPFDEWIAKFATKEREELKKIMEVYKRYG